MGLGMAGREDTSSRKKHRELFNLNAQFHIEISL